MRLAWHVTLARDLEGRLPDPEKLDLATQRYADAVTGEGTTVEVRYMEPAASATVYPAISMINGSLLMADIRRCEREGFDGVMIAAAGAPALHETRSVTGIPVVGSVEAGLALSTFIGTKVGLVTINPGYAAIMEQNARLYGFGDRLISDRPVRQFGMSWTSVGKALDGDPDELLSGFEASVAELVAAGADVVVGAAQIFGAILMHTGRRAEGVPFVDGAAAGLKALETLIELRSSVGLTTSDLPHSRFRRVPEDALAQAFRAVGLEG